MLYPSYKPGHATAIPQHEKNAVELYNLLSTK
jgi:hypothetical protein